MTSNNSPSPNHKRQTQYSISPDKYLTPGEYDHLVSLLLKYSHPNLIHTTEFRDVTMLRVALETGARATEVLNIGPRDLDLVNSRIFIRGLKHSKDRHVPLSLELFRNVLALSQKSPDGRPFRMSYQHMRITWMAYRPVKKKLHCLRHTFAIRLYDRLRDLRLVMLALGHKSIMNTMVYLEISDQDELYRILEKPRVPAKGLTNSPR